MQTTGRRRIQASISYNTNIINIYDKKNTTYSTIYPKTSLTPRLLLYLFIYLYIRHSFNKIIYNFTVHVKQQYSEHEQRCHAWTIQYIRTLYSEAGSIHTTLTYWLASLISFYWQLTTAKHTLITHSTSIKSNQLSTVDSVRAVVD